MNFIFGLRWIRGIVLNYMVEMRVILVMASSVCCALGMYGIIPFNPEYFYYGVPRGGIDL